MAFRQPTLPPIARPVSAPAPEQDANPPNSSIQETLDTSREWVLFPHAASAAATHSTQTERKYKTAGLSRLSDFGSRDTIDRSEENQELHYEGTFLSEQEDELDSLDDGLHAFQESSPHYPSGHLDQSGSIFPRHDGLGTFTASNADLQDQIWHFEQHNPRKRSLAGHHRRRSSVQRRLDAVTKDDARKVEDEKRERIENWRLEHSRILLDEIEKQARRRQSNLSGRSTEHDMNNVVREQSTLGTADNRTDSKSAQQPSARGPVTDKTETLLQRVTRRVIRDFIGLDDETLSVVLGETLPTETPFNQPSSKSSIPTPTAETLSWETRLLNRLVREFVILFDQLTENPDVFSTPSLLNTATLDYAGIPTTQPTSSRTHRPHQSTARPPASSFTFNFHPSPAANDADADAHYASLWGIDASPTQCSQEHTDEEYWSQPLSLRSALRFLHTRFATSRRPSNTSTTASPNPSFHLATTSTPDSLRRTAMIRQYHPLVNKTLSSRRRHSSVTRRSWAAHGGHPRYGYAGSVSCGSQSLR